LRTRVVPAGAWLARSIDHTTVSPENFRQLELLLSQTAIELGKGEASAEPEWTLIIELVKHNSEIWMRKSAPRKFAG
jgi:hypothetical protein